MSSPWGLYLHVPWCRRRCPYCAFYVEVEREVPWEAFVDALLREHDLRRPDFGPEPPDSVFLGGGTPSRMPPACLARLLARLPRRVGAEVSLETNPEDVSASWLEAVLGAGVNRLSLGVQTFSTRHARALNRACTVPKARQTLELVASSAVPTWSVDLIFGLPGQTLEELEDDLRALLEVRPPHVSLYGLTYEPGTAFERARRRGRFLPPDEGLFRAMLDLLVERLQQGGLERYEVSNFARPGHRSRHNVLYWTDRPYLGLGPAAHGYAPDGSRWANLADVIAWMAADDPTAERERPSPAQAAVDLLLSALRGVGGLDLAHLARRTGHGLPADALFPPLREGLLEQDGSRIRLTEAGFALADALTARLADRLEPLAPVPPVQRARAAPGRPD